MRPSLLSCRICGPLKKEPRNVAHTFSCLVYRSRRQCRPKGHHLGLSPTEMNIVDCSFYSFACVNMSKIFCQSGGIYAAGPNVWRIFYDWLLSVAHPKILTYEWRITDSNR